MNPLSAATAALLLLGLTTGCVTRPITGEYRDFRYDSCRTKPRHGEIAVAFDPESELHPPIQWQLFTTGFESGWRRVCASDAPRYYSFFEQAYGIEFRIEPGGKNPLHCAERPLESRMLRVRDQQQLTVPVAFP